FLLFMNKTSGSPIVIIHFNPLERFPPVVNLLNYLVANSAKNNIVISSRRVKETDLNNFVSGSRNVTVKRTPAIISNSVFRIFHYLFFYGYSFYLLLKYNPKSVLYFESNSSWPALFYKKLRGNKVKLLAHYHEYNTPLEYQNGMRLVKAMHQMEQKMYPFAFDWISQTNEIRLKRFIDDNHLGNVDQLRFHSMPNYPSQYWAKGKTNFNSSDKIRLVYVGSLGYDTMYLKQVTDWVLLNKKTLSLDLYSDNIDDKATTFLQSIKDDAITFHGGCAYEELPAKLINYDIGLVIYKPVSENWVHNAPNKVFEYLACGLDVWFSKTMTYTSSILREDVYPKIMAVNFERMDEFDVENAVNREGLKCKESEYFYEEVYGEICKALS
ncbi:MAG: hypothetical protein ABI372_11650, partial [Ginsengibacter sp.]